MILLAFYLSIAAALAVGLYAFNIIVTPRWRFTWADLAGYALLSLLWVPTAIVLVCWWLWPQQVERVFEVLCFEVDA